MEWKSIAPWNWFRKEEERSPTVSAGGEDPFRALHAQMDRMLDDVFGRKRRPLEAMSLLRPSVDISEGRKAYTLRVEVPGVEKGDVSVEMVGDTLFIRGEKKQEKEEEDEGYHCVERSYGRFERVLSLPDDADPAEIDAKFKNGVLRVRIPKRAAVETGRSIEIHHE